MTFASNKLKKSKIGKQFRVEDNNMIIKRLKRMGLENFLKLKEKLKTNCNFLLPLVVLLPNNKNTLK